MIWREKSGQQFGLGFLNLSYLWKFEVEIFHLTVLKDVGIGDID